MTAVADRTVPPGPSGGSPDFARRLLHVAELVTLGAFVLMVLAALIAARFGTSGLPLRVVPFAGWGLGAAVSALTLANAAGDAYWLERRSLRRRLVTGLLLCCLLGCVTGVVANSAGVAGPSWVLFLPVVLVSGAVGGAALGLLTGAGAAAGLYVAAGLSHTLTLAGVGRLVVLLPAFPAVGWSAGALAGHVRRAALEARRRREALRGELAGLSALLDRVADGDLTIVPAPGDGADPATQAVAVVFADTLLALRRLVRQMDGVATQLSSSAVDLAGAAEQEATAIEAQVGAVAETMTTIEELAATAGSIAETAVRVARCAGSTRRDVDAGTAAVAAATESMGRIAERVADLDRRADRLLDSIGRIDATTRLIDELARRTSILSVNASVEAARAGQHGAGFANVAAEVSTLATRAREATARISVVLTELRQEAAATATAGRDGRDAVDVGADLQAEVVAVLGRIAAMVDRTTVAARQITDATRQQRIAADAVVGAMVQVTAAGEHYREGGRRHAAAAARLRDLAGELRHALARFKVT